MKCMSTLTAEQEQLVVENEGLVHFIAKRYYHQNMEHADFAQVGMIGLMKASRIFDANKGFKFSTIAGKCIEGEIIKSIRKKRVQAISFNETFSDDSTELIDMIANDINVQTEVALKIDMQQALSRLNELELFVINHSFGINTGQSLSQSRIGKMLNLSQAHIGRLKRNALEKMRKDLEGTYS